MQSKVVHVVGTGTIGEPLISLLANFREHFGIDEVTFHKRTPLPTDKSTIETLAQAGAKLCVDSEQWPMFHRLGMQPVREAEEAIERAK